MYPTSRIPVPRSIKRNPSDSTHLVALHASPSEQKSVRVNTRSPRKITLPPLTTISPVTAVHRMSLAPTRQSPLATPPRRNNRLSMYGVPLALERKQSGLRKNFGGNGKKVTVCARKRPLSSMEIKKNTADCVVVDGERNTLTISAVRTKLDGIGKYGEEFDFSFDKVFDSDAPNSRVYKNIVRPLVDFALKGGKSTCFAYGQTGSGKTHTMFHPKDGLCYSAIKDLFNSAGSNECYISFFEIYQSQLYDLLRERKKVIPCEKADGQVKIMGLCEDRVTFPEESLEIIQRGLNARITGKTGANAQSSRSHAILQFSLRPANSSSDFGRLTFIDLAGSERGADRAEVDHRTRLEGSEINKSLLALKECIRAIDMDASHLPFRQSKLTLVLKNSIIGDVRTAMIATVSPSIQSCEHSLNTLRYADRFKEIGECNNGGDGNVGYDDENVGYDDENENEGENENEQQMYSDFSKDETPKKSNSWTVSPVARISSPVKMVTFSTPDRLEKRRQNITRTIGSIQQNVQKCTDADVLELLGEELVTLFNAFQSLV